MAANGMTYPEPRRRHIAAMLACAALTLCGCGSAGVRDNSATPNPPPPTGADVFNTYAGTQSVQGAPKGTVNVPVFGGVWTLGIDRTTGFFTYQNIGHQQYQGVQYLASINGGPCDGCGLPPSDPVLGSFSPGSFLTLTANQPSAGGSGTPPPSPAAGYALEIIGHTAILRPGGPTMLPVFSVAGNACPTLTGGTETYQFILLGTTNSADPVAHAAYGSVAIGNSGRNWSFANLTMTGYDGSSIPTTPIPAGSCANTQEGNAITVVAGPATNNLPLTAALEDKGFFIMDQGQGDPNAETFFAPTPAATGPLGLVGVAQPASPLDTNAIAAGKYLGFEYDSVGDVSGNPGSLPVAFGVAAGSGTTMTGGTYPNDDLTQPLTSDIQIDLGTQDPANNGLYPAVTVTVPDTYGGCVGQTYGGVNAAGNPTCIFQGKAVAGNPNGKFALFVTAADLSYITRGLTPNAARQFFLYQQ